MMRRSRLLKAGAALFAATLVLAACGNDDDASTDDTAVSGDGDFAGQVVTILGPETGVEAEGFVAGFAPWEEATGATIQYTGSRDSETQVNLAVEGGDPPDLAVFPQPGRLVQFAEDGDIVPVPDDVLASIENDYDQFWFDLVTYDGQVYGVPNKGDVKSLVWYSPAVFEENGYEIPETWDELMALTDQAREDGITPWCVGLGSGDATGWPFTDWMEDVMLRMHGPDVYDQWVSNEMPFDDPRVVEVAETVTDIWFVEGNVLGGRDAIAATGFKEAALPVADGDCLMHRQANFVGADFVEQGNTLGPDGDVNVFYLPTMSDEFGQVLLGAGTYVAAFNDDPATMSALAFLGSAEYANARIEADKGGFLSPNKAHDTALYSSDFDQGLAEILVSADPIRFDASDLMPGEVGAGEWWRSGTDYVSGAITVQQFVDNVQNAWPS